MTHRFPIKEIALQAGLSTATVDRVVNERAHVSPQTKARVAAALRELEDQEAQLAARGRRMFVDIVVEAPDRFAREIRAAVGRVLPHLGAGVIRPRFEMHEVMTGPQTVAILDRIVRRGSQGICLKARDLPEIRAVVARATARGIAVVTIFTDLPETPRIAYAGLDNAGAGRTAAWIMARMLGAALGTVLTSQSNTLFAGEEARFRAFVAELARLAPGLAVQDVSGGGGLNLDTARRFAAALPAARQVCAVYSMGGGNRAILSALAQAGVTPEVFVAHDLDSDNLALLTAGRVTVVLDHDLAEDMRDAFLHLMAAHRLAPPLQLRQGSDIRIVTPANLPRRLAP